MLIPDAAFPHENRCLRWGRGVPVRCICCRTIQWCPNYDTDPWRIARWEDDGGFFGTGEIRPPVLIISAKVTTGN